MNGNTRIGILVLLGVVVVVGVITTAVAHDSSEKILQLCTLVCVSLLAVLHQSTANKLDTVAMNTDAVVKQTDGLAKALANTAGKAGFLAGAEAERVKTLALPEVVRDVVANVIDEKLGRNSGVIG